VHGGSPADKRVNFRGEAVFTDLLFRTAARTMYIMNVDACGIWLLNQKGSLVPRVYYGIRTDFANELFSEKNFRMLRCILNQNAPVQIHSMARYSNKALRPYIKSEGLKSFLACPITVKGTKVGIIAVCTRNHYREFSDSEQMVFSTLAHEIALSIRTEGLSERVRADYLNTIKTIAYILEANDEYTYGHSSKVMKHCMSICKMMKLPEKATHTIKNAALLHDIGKIGIDRDILKKKGKLTVCEWEQIKEHPVIGAAIIEQTGFLNELIPVVEHHHERFEGGGYPNPDLTSDKIPLGARVIAIADSYDAMTSARPYRDHALTPKIALEELKRNVGKQFDPDLVGVFTAYMTEETKIIKY
jgi:putative nucleotidyltransferase with HDIG domain